MLVRELLELFNFDKLKALKTTTLIAVIGFLYHNFYLPYHIKQLMGSREFTNYVKERVEVEFGMYQAKELSFELKLSKESGIPLYMIPRKISGALRDLDSAKSLYPEIEQFTRIIPVGIILNGERVMYVDHRGRFRYPEEDSKGYFRFLENGKKHYLYLK